MKQVRRASSRRLFGGGSAIAAAAAALLMTAAFRCPGPEPSAEATGGGGQGGEGGSGVTTGDVSSGSGCSVDVSSDVANCGGCGRLCGPMGVLQPHCTAGLCDSMCLPGFGNLKMPAFPAPDDGCETPVRRVFVTSKAFPPDFGSASNGDGQCVTIAMDLGLGGMWRAWLSDEMSSPDLRFTHATVPYVLLDGTVVANDWNDLVDSSLQHAIDVDETHQTVPVGTKVWTGTGPDGKFEGAVSTCSNWISVQPTDTTWVGSVDQNDDRWTDESVEGCDQLGVRIYCFEQ